MIIELSVHIWFNTYAKSLVLVLIPQRLDGSRYANPRMLQPWDLRMFRTNGLAISRSSGGSWGASRYV
jgi:hypothetical protein